MRRPGTHRYAGPGTVRAATDGKATVAQDERVKQACAYLRLLLLRPGDYRDQWAGENGHDPVEIDHGAVAAVLSAAGTPTDPETVRRALTGVDLSPVVLDSFIDAFGLSARHAQRLRDVLRGSEATRVITGDALGPAELYRHSGPPGYETLALHEMHTLGPDGRPAEHQTIQVIRSTVDRLESYPYRFDTDELSVEVTRGGKVGQRIYRVSDTLYAVDIVLDRPLTRGQSSLMQLHSTFFYDSAPPTEFRRGLARATRDVSIWVTFHPHRLPSRVWAASWDGLDDSRIISREPAELDDQRSVNRRFDVVERAIVGFSWEW
jgi:hypothetical protein